MNLGDLGSGAGGGLVGALISWFIKGRVDKIEDKVVFKDEFRMHVDGVRTRFNNIENGLKEMNKKHDAQLKALSRIEGRDRKSTRLNSSHIPLSRMPSSA